MKYFVLFLGLMVPQICLGVGAAEVSNGDSGSNERGYFDIALTGPCSLEMSVEYMDRSPLICLLFKSTSCSSTSTTNFQALGSLPKFLRPREDTMRTTSCRTVQSGSHAVGRLRVNGNGDIFLNANATTGSFGSGNSAGFSGSSTVCYLK